MRNHFLRSRIRTSLWTPAQITTALWFDAADSSSIILNGNNVSQWNDKSGNSRNIIQATSSAQPAYTSQVNGRNVVTFDGGDVLATSGNTAVGISSRTTFIVGSTLTDQLNNGFLSIAPNTGEDWNSQNGFVSSTSNSTTYFDFIGASNSYFLPFSGATATPLGIYGEVLSGTTGTGYLNGTSVVTDSIFTAFNSTNTGPIIVGGRFLGGSISGSFRLVGTICEIVYCASALSDTDRQLVEGYLAHKWGLAASLPGGHPYKSSPP